MLYVLTGSNIFTRNKRQQEIIANLNMETTSPNIENLTLSELSTLLLGESLFFEPSILVLNNLSQRADIFSQALEMILTNQEKAEIILVEDSLDKRTVLYKKLVKNSKIEEFKPLTERDYKQLEGWLKDYIKKDNIKADASDIGYLVEWVGPDQVQLATAADRLILMEDFTKKGIETYIPRTPSSFSFDLLAAAINGDLSKVQEILNDLKKTQDPYRLFGLLTSQLIQAVAVSYAGPRDSVAADLGANTFALNNIKRSININQGQALKAIDILHSADGAIKTSTAEPWQAVEMALVELTQIKK